MAHMSIHNELLLALQKNGSPEALQAMNVIRTQEKMIDEDVCRMHAMERSLKLHNMLIQRPVAADQAQDLVHKVTNKYRVADHFNLTPQDVADVINQANS